MYLPKDDSFPCYEGVGRASRGVAPELDEVSKRLLRAAEIIRERGWFQNGSWGHSRGYGPVCAIGAISLAYNDGKPHVMGSPEEARLLSHLNTWSVEVWNDAPERTKEQVIEALTLAAHRHEVAAYP